MELDQADTVVLISKIDFTLNLGHLVFVKRIIHQENIITQIYIHQMHKIKATGCNNTD